MARPKKQEFNQIKYEHEYNKKNLLHNFNYHQDKKKNFYDGIEISVPKGKKAVIKEAAKAAGQSVNEFISQAIDERMERDGK